jgi:hypothetical protein
MVDVYEEGYIKNLLRRLRRVVRKLISMETSNIINLIQTIHSFEQVTLFKTRDKNITFSHSITTVYGQPNNFACYFIIKKRV